MQKTSTSKTAAPTQRSAAQQPARKPGAAPQPLDLKTLDRVAGGTTPQAPKGTW